MSCWKSKLFEYSLQLRWSQMSITKTNKIYFGNTFAGHIRGKIKTSGTLCIHRRLVHSVAYKMLLCPDYQQWATGGPPDVTTFTGQADVAMEVEVDTRMWISGDPLIHIICRHLKTLLPDLKIDQDIAICCSNSMWNYQEKQNGRFLFISRFVKGTFCKSKEDAII